MLTPLAPPPVVSCDRILPNGTAIMAGSGASGGMKPVECEKPVGRSHSGVPWRSVMLLHRNKPMCTVAGEHCIICRTQV